MPLAQQGCNKSRQFCNSNFLVMRFSPRKTCFRSRKLFDFGMKKRQPGGLSREACKKPKRQWHGDISHVDLRLFLADSCASTQFDSSRMAASRVSCFFVGLATGKRVALISPNARNEKALTSQGSNVFKLSSRPKTHHCRRRTTGRHRRKCRCHPGTDAIPVVFQRHSLGGVGPKHIHRVFST